MKKNSLILFLLLSITSCKPTSELFLRRDFIEREIKIIESGGNSNYQLEKLEEVLTFTNEEIENLNKIDFLAKKCPKPKPPPPPKSEDGLLLIRVRKIALTEGVSFNVELPNRIMLKDTSKCMESPLLILKLDKNVKVPTEIVAKIKGELSNYDFKYSVLLRK